MTKKKEMKELKAFLDKIFKDGKIKQKCYSALSFLYDNNHDEPFVAGVEDIRSILKEDGIKLPLTPSKIALFVINKNPLQFWKHFCTSMYEQNIIKSIPDFVSIITNSNMPRNRLNLFIATSINTIEYNFQEFNRSKTPLTAKEFNKISMYVMECMVQSSSSKHIFGKYSDIEEEMLENFNSELPNIMADYYNEQYKKIAEEEFNKEQEAND